VFENGIYTGLYKWWGPNPEINLGSGMDDWPRADPDGWVSKYNLDCSSWGYFFADAMS